LFVRQLRVKRVGGKLAVALEDEAHADAHAANADTRPQDLTQGELKALLDGAPKSRSSLRYLAAVENGLNRKDPTGLFLYEVEPARLQAALRARIVDAIGTQEQQQQRLEMLMPRSDLMQGNKVEVAEARASDFDRAS